MKDMDIISPLIPHGPVWIYQLGQNKSAKLSTFLQQPKRWKWIFFTSAENLFLAHFFQNAVIQWQIKIFPWNQLQVVTIFTKFSMRESKL